VLAFGSPFGYFQFSVTRGIVSALNRPNPYSDDPRKPGDFIQTDAAINPGNSGGPLVNAHGELVGINTFIITGNGSFAGAGFAIPAQIARSSAESIIKSGTVHHGYLGISMNDVTPDNASFFNLPDASGAIVSQVTPDSPASHAGLKSGDVLRDLDGKKDRQWQRAPGRRQPAGPRQLHQPRHSSRRKTRDTQGHCRRVPQRD
jgi:serine protease Do